MNASLQQRAGLLFQRRIVSPVLHLLRQGATPRRLAWSLALGAAIGLNPLLGISTVLCLLLAFVLRLNVIAMQIANHVVYPLQLALVFVFLRAGAWMFHTPPMPLAPATLIAAMRSHPVETFRILWTWQWHALVVWALAAAILTPLTAAALRPLLNRLLHRMNHEATSPS